VAQTRKTSHVKGLGIRLKRGGTNSFDAVEIVNVVRNPVKRADWLIKTHRRFRDAKLYWLRSSSFDRPDL